MTKNERSGEDRESAGDYTVDPELVRSFLRASNGLTLAVMAIGVLVLLGWTFDAPRLHTIHPSFGSMKPNTALGFMLAGAALQLSRASRHAVDRALGRLFAAMVALLGALTLMQTLSGGELGIDRAFFDFTPPPGDSTRMSPVTAGLFILLGASIALIDARVGMARCFISECLALLVGLTSFFVLVGYLYGVGSEHPIAAFATVALHTAVCFLLASAAVLFGREGGTLRVMAGRDPGGLSARLLVPTALCIPIGTGWLRLQGERAGLYGFEFGLALFAVSNCVLFSVLTVWAAGLLRRADGVRRQAERALRDNEESLSITLNSIGDAVIATDTSARVTRMNPVARALTGWSLAEAVGRPFEEIFQIVDETTREVIESPVGRVLREGVAVSRANHAALIARDGSQCVIADSAAPITDSRGGVRGAVLIFRDQTQQRLAADALELSRARFARLSEAGLIGLVVATLPDTIVDVNDVFARIVGYSREELLSGTVRAADLNLPEWRGADERAREELRSRGVASPYEKEYLRKDGVRVPVLVGAVVEGGSCVAFALDLREKRRAAEARVKLVEEAAARARAEEALKSTEQQLHQAQKMEAVGRLAGGVAHDFNNLLSVILGYAQLLLDGVRPHDPMHADLEQILMAGKRGSNLTRQLLAFSRQQVLAPRRVDLNETFRGMRDMLRRLIGEDIELELRAGSQGIVHVDPGQMEQVLMNLVVNARDAMPRGGCIRIETADVLLDAEYAELHVGAKPGPHVMFSVSDSGVGMDAATRARIFEPFFTTKGDRGTGLGLSTVFGIVKQSEGHVWVYSELGQGTTFKIFIPHAEVAVDGAVSATGVSLAAPQRGSETVLLVEDDAQVRALTYKVLKRNGYDVIESSSGGEALIASAQHAGAIHLLFTDVIMPRMSGRDLAEQLARERPEMKVLFMSGYTDDAVLHHGVMSSEMAFVQKPLVFSQLLTKIREVLDQP